MLFIPLEEIRGKNKTAVIKFLLKYEEYCVQLMAHLKRNISNSYVVYVNDINHDNLYGIISLKKTVLYLLPYINSNQDTALQEDFVYSLRKFIQDEKIAKPVCINGETEGMNVILKAYSEMNVKPSQINLYNLLKLDVQTFLKSLKSSLKNKPEDLQVIKCRKEMSENLKKQLVELQKEYEVEEVVPDCFEFDEDSCRLRFAQALRTQYILALKKTDGEIISKAGTNAIAQKTVQIGGVYTAKNFRGKGYANFLMKMLLFKIVKMHRNVVLFVKVQNQSANNLYNSLSFRKIGSYSIAYFN